MDIISTLPDEILGHILSFLPTKQAASTSLLSRRWRNLFLLVSSLDFDYRWTYNRRNFINFVESLLRLQGKSLIKKFALKVYRYGLDPTCVQNWICNVLERGVVDLNLFFVEINQPLSSLIFKNDRLVKLRLGGVFKIKFSQDVYLPKLKTLCLDLAVYDGVHGDVFETLLPNCPVLEELVVENRLWVKGHSSVSSRSLKKLIIGFLNTDTITLDVPNLVYLELSCSFGIKYASVNLNSLVEARLNLYVSGLQLQKLRHGSAYLFPSDSIDIIIHMRNVRVLHLSSDVLEMCYFSGQELPRFDNLGRLFISSEKNHGWQILPLLIKNSPNLEILIFKGLEHCKTIDCGDVCVCTGSKEKNRPSCLSSCRVKVLEIWDYKGSSKELNQMKHFLKKLPCLELVKIKAVSNVKVPKYIQQLWELPRASSNCKIQVSVDVDTTLGSTISLEEIVLASLAVVVVSFRKIYLQCHLIHTPHQLHPL